MLAAWLMLQQPEPDDARDRRSHRCEASNAPSPHRPFDRLRGHGVDEKESTKTGQVLVKIDPRYFRPTEVIAAGDAGKLTSAWAGGPKSVSNSWFVMVGGLTATEDQRFPP
jgi:GDP-D-mannose dehydratase